MSNAQDNNNMQARKVTLMCVAAYDVILYISEVTKESKIVLNVSGIKNQRMTNSTNTKNKA
jgi:hypothetical protein